MESLELGQRIGVVANAQYMCDDEPKVQKEEAKVEETPNDKIMKALINLRGKSKMDIFTIYLV